MPFLQILRVRGRARTRCFVRLGILGVFFAFFGLRESHSLVGRPLAGDSSRPRSVSLYVSILDKDGKPVDGVTSRDVTVLEENKEQVITALQFERGSAVSVGVLVDVSRSMGGESINQALSWLKVLSETLKSPDEIFVNAFSDESQEVVDYVSPEDYLGEALDHLGTGGQARMGLAVDLALIKLRDARNPKRAVLILSAGRDIAGPATLDHISKFGFPIYSLGIPGSAGATGTLDRLKNLNLKGSALKVYAEHSGGDAQFVQSTSEAEMAIARICLQMKNQYRLEYTSNNKSKPGKLLKVEVKSRNPDWEVRYPKKHLVSSR
jgi:VWFA-related protein